MRYHDWRCVDNINSKYKHGWHRRCHGKVQAINLTLWHQGWLKVSKIVYLILTLHTEAKTKWLISQGWAFKKYVWIAIKISLNFIPGPVTWKMVPSDNVIMSDWNEKSWILWDTHIHICICMSIGKWDLFCEWHIIDTRALFQYEGHLSRCTGSHHKDSHHMFFFTFMMGFPILIKEHLKSEIVLISKHLTGPRPNCLYNLPWHLILTLAPGDMAGDETRLLPSHNLVAISNWLTAPFCDWLV